MGDPYKFEFILINEPEFFPEVVSQMPQSVVDDFGLVRHKKDQVSGCHVDLLFELLFFLIGKKFGNG